MSDKELIPYKRNIAYRVDKPSSCRNCFDYLTCKQSTVCMTATGILDKEQQYRIAQGVEGAVIAEVSHG